MRWSVEAGDAGAVGADVVRLMLVLSVFVVLVVLATLEEKACIAVSSSFVALVCVRDWLVLLISWY